MKPILHLRKSMMAHFPASYNSNNYPGDYSYSYKSKSSRPEVCKKGLRGNFAKFTGKHLCQSLFFNKVAGPDYPQQSTNTHQFHCSHTINLPHSTRIS